jgi:hypothetical protein
MMMFVWVWQCHATRGKWVAKNQKIVFHAYPCRGSDKLSDRVVPVAIGRVSAVPGCFFW